MIRKNIVLYVVITLCIQLLSAQSSQVMYVNSFEGLRVRDFPGLSGTIINRLKHLDKVIIIGEGKELEEIDGISSKWKNVRFGNSTGWIFGGYLEDSPDKIKFINNTIGKYYFSVYIDMRRNGKNQDISNATFSDYFLEIKYIGNSVFKATYYSEFTDTLNIPYTKIIESRDKGNAFFKFEADSAHGSYYSNEFTLNKDNSITYHYYYESQSENEDNNDIERKNTIEYHARFIKR